MSEYKIKQTAYDEGEIKPSLHMENTIREYSKIIHPISQCRKCDVGFDGSQKPYEFYNAWKVLDEILKKEETPTFLEVGAYKGLWAIAFFEWCKINNKRGEYYTITWLELNPENNDLLKVQTHYTNEGYKFKLFNLNSQIQSTKNEILKERQTFSFVFIDADHSYVGAKKDIELYSSLATSVLGFHDIRPRNGYSEMEVYKAITDSNITFDKEFICDDTHMGIGLKFIN